VRTFLARLAVVTAAGALGALVAWGLMSATPLARTATGGFVLVIAVCGALGLAFHFGMAFLDDQDEDEDGAEDSEVSA
jgi:high-affinity Fe2+/Pb2+ permease